MHAYSTGVALPSSALHPFLSALMEGDRETCCRMTDSFLEMQVPILRLYQGLFQPALYRIGELWSANRISVAVEHMATAITEGLLNRVYPSLINPRRCGRKAVLATVEKELHQVGVKMAADVFEMHGWDTVFPGADLPCEELLRIIERERPDMLGISFSVFFHLDTLERMLVQIRREHPELPILIGGQGVVSGDCEVASGFEGVQCITSLEALEETIHVMG